MSQIIINGQPLYQVDLPEMTMAQWLALPVAERPKEWIRTDAEYTDIPAENVELSDGTSVEDALTWNLVGSETGTNTISVPNQFREIMVISKYQQGQFIKVIPFEQFTDSVMQFFDGGYLNASNNASACWYYANGTIRLNWVSWGNSTVDLNNATTFLYYR